MPSNLFDNSETAHLHAVQHACQEWVNPANLRYDVRTHDHVIGALVHTLRARIYQREAEKTITLRVEYPDTWLDAVQQHAATAPGWAWRVIRWLLRKREVCMRVDTLCETVHAAQLFPMIPVGRPEFQLITYHWRDLSK